MKIFNRKIPQEAHEKLNHFERDGIRSISFNSNGGWVIITGKNKSFARNIPADCNEILNQFIDDGHQILNVSFCPYKRNSWVINTESTSFSRNIPEECFEKIKEFQDQGKLIRQVVFPFKHHQKNSWVILCKDNSFFARNIDDECYQILRNFKQKINVLGGDDQQLNFIGFEQNGGWVMSTKIDLFARFIDDELFEKALDFYDGKNSIDLISFPPQKGWSIISNNKFSQQNWDVISKFEKSVGAKGIWNEMREQDVPGVSVAVVENGRVKWKSSYGHLKRNDRKNAVHPETFFQAASVSKVVAAVGAFKLIETGLVGLNDDLQNKLAEAIPVHSCFQNYNQQGSVTIKNILNHNSGIDGRGISFSASGCKVQGGGYGGYPKSRNQNKIPDTDEIFKGSGNATTDPITITYNRTSGSFNYSGPAFIVLQKLTEDLTGQSYDIWMKENVLAPLGMELSKFTTKPEDNYGQDELTWGHEGSDFVRNRYPEYAAAGLYSNPVELCNIIIMLNNEGRINGNRFLKKSNIDLILKGDGVNLSDGNINSSINYYCHGGSNKGYRSFLIGFPNIANDSRGLRDSGIVVMLNKNYRAFRYQVVNEIIKAYGWN